MLEELEEDFEELEELARTGEFGTAESTKVCKRAAINNFSGFLEIEARGTDFVHSACLTSAIPCDLSRLHRFATYLMKIARDDRGDLLRPGTCLRYFSGITR